MISRFKCKFTLHYAALLFLLVCWQVGQWCFPNGFAKMITHLAKTFYQCRWLCFT